MGSGRQRNVEPGDDYDKCFEQFVDAAITVADEAAQYEIKVAIEPLNKGETKELFRGIYPKISKDGTKLAYFPYPGGTIKVRDLSNDKEWKINANYFTDFCFSPDGRFICTVEVPFILSRYSNVVKIWDYKTGASKTLLSSKYYDRSSDLDWIE